MTSSEPIYLLADMHLKPLDAPNAKARNMAVAENERLARFFQSLVGKSAKVILLGDTFNFWFERKSHYVGDYDTALSLFKLAAENGLEFHHVSGNRDYAVGEGLGFDPNTRYQGFLKLRKGFTVSRLADFGIEPHGPRYRFHHAGKTVSCIHGDALCTDDRWFMSLRWLLQGPVGKTVMRWAPWMFLESLVGFQQGRTRMRNPTDNPGRLLAEQAIRRELAMGADLILCGHIHAHHEREIDGFGRRGRLVALPAWMNGFYGVLEGNEVRIEEFR